MSSRGPPLVTAKTSAGIAVDPRTLDRVVPESRRADGSVRKERKIRPGFTPQEDVQRFRGTRQAAQDARQGLVAGQRASVPGAPPGARSLFASAVSAANASVPGSGVGRDAGAGDGPTTKAAKKNAARRKKKAEKREEGDGEAVPDNWDDDETGPTPAEKSGVELEEKLAGLGLDDKKQPEP